MDRLWRINRTIIEKLQDTGYDVSLTEVSQVSSLQAFETAFPQALNDASTMERIFYPRKGTIAELRAPNGVFIAFTVTEGKNIVTEDVRRVIQELDNNNVTTCFYIVNRPVYSKAMEVIRSVEAVQRIVIFRHEQLGFNVTKHRRVPRHQLLDPASASKWLATTQVKRSQIPRLFEDDPVAKYYDAQPTELMHVTNPSPTVGIFTRTLVVARRLVR